MNYNEILNDSKLKCTEAHTVQLLYKQKLCVLFAEVYDLCYMYKLCINFICYLTSNSQCLPFFLKNLYCHKVSRQLKANFNKKFGAGTF